MSSFKAITSKPTKNDPYIYLYNNSNNGGKSLCINGKPTDKTCNVLCNCVGWACGRFNHIYNIITGYNGIKYPMFCCNAENFIEVAKKYGLTVSSIPKPGSIIVWQKGRTLSGKDGAGHVAVVEQVLSSNKIITSESGYNSFAFTTKVRTNDNKRWGVGSSYTFRGFIHNPAVTDSTRVDIVNKGDNLSANESRKTIFKWLTTNGFSEIAASGIMGCWQAESRNMADRIEGDYLKNYPGHDVVLANANSINQWTNRLFNIYANENIGINKNAYKAADGNYYAGLGLAQWTGPRAYNLIEYAKTINKSFRSTSTQLSFFKNHSGELPSRKGLINDLNNASTPEDAATIFLDGFEMYKGWHNKNDTGRKQNKARRENARSIYNEFKKHHSTENNIKPTSMNPDNNQIHIKVSDLRIRKSPSLSGMILGYAKPGYYNYINTVQKDGYKWYAIGKDAWVAYSKDWMDIHNAKTIAVGDKVHIMNGAPVYGSKSKFQNWVYRSDLYIRKIDKDKITVSIYKTGAITGSVDKKYIIV